MENTQTKSLSGLLSRLFSRRLKREEKSLHAWEQQVLIGAAMGLCLATMERGQKLDAMMSNEPNPASYAVMVPDGKGRMIEAAHRLDHTEAVTLKVEHPVAKPILYAKNTLN